MTILDQTTSRAENGTVAEPGARVTRPTLERDAPIRNWATLFGPAWGATAAAAAGSALPGAGLPGAGLGGGAIGGMANAANAMLGAASQTLADAVGQGYRVINEYLAQGQRQAEALRFPDWSSFLPNVGGAGPAGSSPGAAAQELQQQLFRRLMQYSMDFAALYFEMMSRTGWPAPPGAATSAAATSAAATSAAATSAAGPSNPAAAWTEAFARAYSPAAWAAAVAPGSSVSGSSVSGSSVSGSSVSGSSVSGSSVSGTSAPGNSASASSAAGKSASGSASSGPAFPGWPFPLPFPWVPPVPPPAAAASSPGAAAEATSGAAPAGTADASESPDRVFVSVASQRPVESVLELRRGSWSTLVAHGLRPEGFDAPAIRGVTIDARPEESLLRVSVSVPADQPPGVYNGMIVDTASNLPRGTLTVRVLAPGGE